MNDSEETEERCYVDILQFCIFSEWPEQTISNPYILLGYIMHLLQEEQCLMFGDATTYPSMCEVSEYFNKSVGGDNHAFNAKLLCVQTVYPNEVFDNLFMSQIYMTAVCKDVVCLSKFASYRLQSIFRQRRAYSRVAGRCRNQRERVKSD